MTSVAVTNQTKTIALIGNPNSGKTTLFNALTGLRQKVANYPGVTVEKKEGRITLPDGSEAVVLDLPGTYSLHPNSPDEQIATNILVGSSGQISPDLVICVVDATNVERNLYLVSQILDLHIPVVVALNMMDVAKVSGVSINTDILQTQLGVAVVPTIANKQGGIQELKEAILRTEQRSTMTRQWQLPEPVQREFEELVSLLQQHHGMAPASASHQAIALLTAQDGFLSSNRGFKPEVIDHVMRDHEKLDFLGFDRQSVFVESRYEWIRAICSTAVHRNGVDGRTFSDKLDRLFTHRIWGYVIFLGLMGLMFQVIYTWAIYPMELIEEGFDWLGQQITTVLPGGDLQSLIVNGGLAGVAAVLTFLPQILFLFLFLGLLEDTGYMSRAAFIMDRVMSKVGLHGKSFIPLLSSFACAIPAIMSTRTIETPKDRLITMLVVPLISCSARLPVFTLMIAAFVPATMVFGFISLPALTMLSLYLLGLGAALTMAFVFKKTLLRGTAPVFIMELPPYRLPSLKSVLLQMWDRGMIFVKSAGTIILGVSIILWFLATYPRMENASPAEQLQQSFVGRAGHLIEPVIKPLGFDWKIGIGLIASLLQREVFVSTMGTIYNVQNADDDDGSISLQANLQRDVDPVTGKPNFTLLTALCVMVYYVLAMQCMSTVAVMRRETNGWKWPAIQFAYMTALAYGVTFIVYQAGLALGLA